MWGDIIYHAWPYNWIIEQNELNWDVQCTRLVKATIAVSKRKIPEFSKMINKTHKLQVYRGGQVYSVIILKLNWNNHIKWDFSKDNDNDI